LINVTLSLGFFGGIFNTAGPRLAGQSIVWGKFGRPKPAGWPGESGQSTNRNWAAGWPPAGRKTAK